MPSRSRPGELLVIDKRMGKRYRNIMGGADEKEEDAKRTFMHDDYVESVVYSPDGTHIVTLEVLIILFVFGILIRVSNSSVLCMTTVGY